MRAAGHVGMQMGAQDMSSGGMEVFFRRRPSGCFRPAGGLPSGRGHPSPSSKAEESSETTATMVKNFESEEEKAEESYRWQCAVCGRWWDPRSASTRRCSTCGSPSFEEARPLSGFGSGVAGGRRAADATDSKHRSHCAKNVGQSQASDGIHGRGEGRVGRGPVTKERRRSRASGNVEKELARVLGRGKVTFDNTTTWPSRSLQPCLVAMLRSSSTPAPSNLGANGQTPQGEGQREERDGGGDGGRPRGSFKAALEAARDKECMVAAVDALKKDFWSDSNRESQLSKRRLAIELAQVVGGDWWVPPLTEYVVLGVAAALKAAGLRTAASLVNELKLWHVEQGHAVSDSLNRLLWLAKKSVSRNLGPVKRALEVKIMDLEGALWQCSWHMDICEPVLAYAWAVIFMLRCAEVAAVRWSHVSVDKAKKFVTLRIPISKTDQTGWGVRRTLGCCGLRRCVWTCAWKVWSELLKRSTSKSEFVFLERFESSKSTRKMTMAWQSKLKAGVTGHSARRSGAMMYVRAGLPLQEVAFLGRWKSNVVLNYAEEALEKVPANQRIVPSSLAAGSKDFSVWKSPRTPKRSSSDLGCNTPVPMTPPAVFSLRTSWRTRTGGRRVSFQAWATAKQKNSGCTS